MKRSVICTLLALAAGPAAYSAAIVKTDAESFSKATEDAKKFDGSAVMQEYRRNAFYPHLSPLLNGAMNQCFSEVPHPSSDAFSFIITLDSHGKITEIALNNPTNLATCVTRKFVTKTLPPPPYSPFLEEIDMKLKP